MERSRPGLALALLCASAFVVGLDATVIAVALPAIERDLGGGVTGLQWIVDGYLLAVACLLLCAGSAGDTLGRHRVYLVGLAGFTALSAVCALAPNLAVLVAGRVGQGVFGAALLAVSLALVTGLYPAARPRARAVGVWAASGALAIALGPVLGGLLIARYGWPSVFWINVPAGVVAVVLLARVLPRQPVRPRQLDLAGQALFAVAAATGSYALIEGGRQGWTSAGILASVAAAGLAGLLFARRERRHPDPMLPPRLLRLPAVALGCAVNFLGLFALFLPMFLVTLYFQDVLRLTAAEAGLRFLALSVAMMVGALWAPTAAVRWGTGRLVVLGAALTAGGLAGLLVSLAGSGHGGGSGGSWWALALIGAGVPIAVAPATVEALTTAPADLVATAAGVLNTARQLGSAAGVAVAGLLLTSGAGFVTGMRAGFAIGLGGAVLIGLVGLRVGARRRVVMT